MLPVKAFVRVTTYLSIYHVRHVQIVLTAHQEYFVAQDPNMFQKVVNEFDLPWSLYVGVLGMPGMLYLLVRFV